MSAVIGRVAQRCERPPVERADAGSNPVMVACTIRPRWGVNRRRGFESCIRLDKFHILDGKAALNSVPGKAAGGAIWPAAGNPGRSSAESISTI